MSYINSFLGESSSLELIIRLLFLIFLVGTSSLYTRGNIMLGKENVKILNFGWVTLHFWSKLFDRLRLI